MTNYALGTILGYGLPPLALVVMMTTFFKKATSHKSAHLLKEKPDLTNSITVPMKPLEALDALVAYAKGNGLKVDAVSSNKDCVVLKEPMSLLSWGFFYPIYLTPKDRGTSLEVGIESRFAQDNPNNPIKKLRFEKIFNGIAGVFTQKVLNPQNL